MVAGSRHLALGGHGCYDSGFDRGAGVCAPPDRKRLASGRRGGEHPVARKLRTCCLLYTSDAADERSSVDLGGRRIIKKKKSNEIAQSSDADDKHEKNHKVEQMVGSRLTNQ